MKKLGIEELLEVEELRNHITEILRAIKAGETIEVMDHGEVIAHVVPTHKKDEEEDDVWTELDRLSQEISARWPEGVSAVDAVRDVRRDL